MSQRRTKVFGALAAIALALLAGTSLGAAQETPPLPQVDRVPLDGALATAGWEGSAPVDSNLVGVEWDGDPAAEFSVEVQHADGEWESVGDVGRVDTGPDAGTKDAARAATTPAENASEPVWVGDDAQAVRVVLADGAAADVTLQTVDAATVGGPAHSALAAGRISGWVLLGGAIVGLLVTSRRSRVFLVAGAVGTVALAGCVSTTPPPPPGILMRSTWGGDLPYACEGLPETTPTITKAIVHHTVNSNDYQASDTSKMVRAIWGYHVFTLGYCDIAYNFLLDKFGTKIEGRLGGMENAVVGAHSLNANIGTTGIAMLGTHTTVQPPAVELQALIDMIVWKFKVHKLDGKSDNQIVGHRDVTATECPGEAAYKTLPLIRFVVRQDLEAAAASSATAAPVYDARRVVGAGEQLVVAAAVAVRPQLHVAGTEPRVEAADLLRAPHVRAHEAAREPAGTHLELGREHGVDPEGAGDGLEVAAERRRDDDGLVALPAVPVEALDDVGAQVRGAHVVGEPQGDARQRAPRRTRSGCGARGRPWLRRACSSRMRRPGAGANCARGPHPVVRARPPGARTGARCRASTASRRSRTRRPRASHREACGTSGGARGAATDIT